MNGIKNLVGLFIVIADVFLVAAQWDNYHSGLHRSVV